MDTITPIITSRIPHPIADHEAEILRRIFNGYQEVIIRAKFDRGLSGSSVFLVRPIRLDSTVELPCVIKIDTKSRAQQEWQGYNNHIKDRLPNSAGIRGEPIIYKEFGGLKYPMIGAGAFNIQSFSDFYKEASTQEICALLEHKLFKILSQIWKQTKVEYDFSLRTLYDSFLTPNLLIECQNETPYGQLTTPETIFRQSFSPEQPLQISGFHVVRVLPQSKTVYLDFPIIGYYRQNAYRIHIRNVPNCEQFKPGEPMPQTLFGYIVQMREQQLEECLHQFLDKSIDLGLPTLSTGTMILPNPLKSLNAIFKQLFDIKIATIHGDLNLENILFDESQNPHLIDFVNSGPDHVLRDFLRLELGIVTHFLSQDLLETTRLPEIPNAIYKFYEQLHFAQMNGATVTPPTGLEKPFHVLLTIRRTASHYLGQLNNWKEYYSGLFCYFMGAMRYEDLNQVNGAKLTAFWAMASLKHLIDTNPQKSASVSPNAFYKMQATINGGGNGNDPILALHELLLNSFNEPELRGLCFELKVDYDDFPGGKTDKIRELIMYYQRRGRLSVLVQACKHFRPEFAWSDI